MKKKLVFLLSLVLVICSLLCGCGEKSTETDGNTSAGTVTVDGAEYTIEELSAIYRNNSLKFNEEFLNKQATVTGKITKFSGACTYNGVYYDSYVDIGQCMVNTSGEESFLAKLNLGDTMTVSGLLRGTMTGIELYRDVSIVKVECTGGE